MNILRLKIVKQTNGKYALWDSEEQCFDRFNCKTPGEILDYVVQRVRGILISSIASHSNDDSQFKMALAEFRDKNGLDTSAKDNAIAILEEMDEWGEGC